MKSLAVKKLFEIGCFYAGQKRFFKTFFYQRVFESLDFDNRKGGLISEKFSLWLKSLNKGAKSLC